MMVVMQHQTAVKLLGQRAYQPLHFTLRSPWLADMNHICTAGAEQGNDLLRLGREEFGFGNYYYHCING